jgi:RNA polymerase sigma-70 factor (ECF subfamily)
MQPEDTTSQTSWTLVAHLKNLDDQPSWDEFYKRYRGVIVAVAKGAGMREDEAEDVLQETMASVSKNIQGFVADPAQGSFRAWLLNMVRWRIQDQHRKRSPVAAGNGTSGEATSMTATVERVPDAREVDLETLCDREWRKWLAAEAWKELQLEVKAEHYQIFYLLEAQEKPIAEVAQLVNRNRAQIYLIKHRVASTLKKIVKRLEDKLGGRIFE